MQVAWLNERTKVAGRKEAFISGLRECGFVVRDQLPTSVSGIFVTWNRSPPFDAIAKQFERAGRPVIVLENSSWNGLVPGHWLHIAKNYHNTSFMFKVGDNDRWDSLGMQLEPWRDLGGEVVCLAQRGIGSPPTAMPKDWISKQKYRIRRHPGRGATVEALRKDLELCSKAVTWGSGAAILACAWGIRIESHMPNWIGEQDNTDAGRLSMFRRLAWAQWRLSEIAAGEPFKWLL